MPAFAHAQTSERLSRDDFAWGLPDGGYMLGLNVEQDLTVPGKPYTLTTALLRLTGSVDALRGELTYDPVGHLVVTNRFGKVFAHIPDHNYSPVSIAPTPDVRLAVGEYGDEDSYDLQYLYALKPGEYIIKADRPLTALDGSAAGDPHAALLFVVKRNAAAGASTARPARHRN